MEFYYYFFVVLTANQFVGRDDGCKMRGPGNEVDSDQEKSECRYHRWPPSLRTQTYFRLSLGSTE